MAATPATVRMFAAAVPRLGQLLANELGAGAGVEATGAGQDGRSDVVLFEVERRAARQVRELELELAERMSSSRSGVRSGRGGRVVLLTPQLPRRAVPATLRPAGSYRIRLLGTWTRLWCFDRVGPHPTR